jgi:uncharacterized RDD family membrane protein YckC
MTAELTSLDGTVIGLASAVVVGREPAAPVDFAGATQVAIGDDMSVSKTHALIEEIHGTVWVTDLGSSNGTEIIDIDGTERSLQAGIPAVAPMGSSIRVGSTSEFTVQSVNEPGITMVSMPVGDATATVARQAVIAPATAVAPMIHRADPAPESSDSLSPIPTSVVVSTNDLPVDAASRLPSDVPDTAVGDRLKTRRIGGWVLAVWGTLTAVWTVVRGDYAVVPTFPTSLFWYPSGLFNAVQVAVFMAAFPLAVGALAGRLLLNPDSDKRVNVAFVAVIVSLPLLLAGAVHDFFNGGPALLAPTVLVLPVVGTFVLSRSLDRPPRVVRVAPLPNGQVATAGKMVSHVGDIEPLPLGTRFAGYVIDVLIGVFTLGIGWLIWSMIVWDRGLSPGKQVVGAVVVDVNTGQVAGFGRMAQRELVGKGILGMLTFGISGIVSSFMVLLGRERRAVHDHVASTIVVRAPQGGRHP